MSFWLLIAAVFLVTCLVMGVVTGVVSRSRGLAISAGVIAGGEPPAIETTEKFLA